MEPLKENGAINLRRTVVKQPATRIIGKTPNLHVDGGFSTISSNKVNLLQKNGYQSIKGSLQPVNLTNNNFSVTRARANNCVVSNNDIGGLKRVLDAALSGRDVKVASIKPMSFSARFIAILLLPTMLVMPLLPAYANEAPLPERIAGDVAEIVATDNLSLASALNIIVDTTNSSSNTVDTNSENLIANATNSNSENLSGEVNLNPESLLIASSTNLSQEVNSSTAENIDPEVAGTSSLNIQSPEINLQPSTITPNTKTGETISENNNAEQNNAGQNSSVNNITTSNSNIISDNSTSTENSILENTIPKTTELQVYTKNEINVETQEENNDEIQILDVASSEVQEDLDSIRARLRKELRDEVKMEVKSEIEKEVYRGCKNLDGLGYYCIPDAKSFGPAIVANERSISVVVQQDEIEGDKEIFLSRDNVALQLTHNSDDDVFPVLDPASDLLVWQSLKDGHWQIAYAHVSDVGVPRVNYLTQGENNFNPKVYRGRIVWQAWVEGNWEIFSASKAYEKLDEESLTTEHRLAHVNGNWDVKRITANNTPDMFPSVTGDAIMWQAIDDGIWQVFSYDLVTGESRRVSKKGVKSESPRTALVWNEEDETGQLKLVGSDINNSEAIDFTEVARRLVDKSKDAPKSPITNTEIVVVTPTIVRVEEEHALSN